MGLDAAFLIGSMLFNLHKYFSVLQQLLIPTFAGLDSMKQVGSKEQEKHVEALNVLKLSIFTSKSSCRAYLETQSCILLS